MKNNLALISLLLTLCLLVGVLASCSTESNNTEQDTSETMTTTQKGENTATGSETEESPSNDPEKIQLDGIYADSILYADHIKNGVQSYYKDDTRNDYCVENLDMIAEFALNAGGNQKLTYLKNQQGDTYLSNTMDVFIRMTDGNTYYASDSLQNARANVYRIGYYYYDVRILEQSFLSDFTISKELDISESLFSHYNTSSVNSFKIRQDIIKYKVTGDDPYFFCKANDINFSCSEYDAIQLSIKTDVSTQAQLFVITDSKPTYNATQSIAFDVTNDGEYHTYTIMLSCLPDVSGNIIGFRLDIGSVNEYVEVKDLKAIRVESSAPFVLLDRTWHTYSDKVHQELHFVAPKGQDNIDALGIITEIPKASVAKLLVKDQNGLHDTLDSIDWNSVEYVGFDIANAGIFGYILPCDNQSGTLHVTNEGDHYLIIQQATPQSGEIRSPHEAGSTANDFFMGHRVYTDSNHEFDEFIKQAEWERNPLEEIGGTSYVGYDALRGAYLFNIGGTDFNSAFHYAQNRHFEANVSISDIAQDRSIYIRTATTSGCLEGAALLGNGGMMLPIPLEVSKNFNEGEEPIMNYKDITYGETVFPFFITKDTDYEITVLNMYQNWGNFPQKQLSSIAYYAPYYHLSIGITETSCISPWYVRGKTLWTLPDFRPLSAPYWFELPGADFVNEPQHTNAGLFENIHYTDADGRYVATENYKNEIDSSGPVYAEVEMSYISDDGKMHVTYNHLELPQTDELRTYYEVKIQVLEDIHFNDFKHDFAFYSWKTERSHIGYLDIDGNHIEQGYRHNDSIKEYVLGKVSPYFGNFGTTSTNAANLGFLIHSYDMTVGGNKFDGNFVVVENGKNDFGLSLDLDQTTLKKGDSLTLNILMIPWGSHLSTDASNLATLRNNSAIDPYTVTSPDSEIIDSVYLPRLKSNNKISAEFTISGGSNNAVVRIYGFEKLTAPIIYEKVNGKWVEYTVSSINTPDTVGEKHYYDGYSVYYDSDGTYSYAFAINMDNVSERTFKIEADQDFEPWPEIEIAEKDPINYLMDAEEMSALFTNAIPGVGSANVMENGEFIRITGDGNQVEEVSAYVFNDVTGDPTGQYIVIKYRIPSSNRENNNFEIFTSTVNDSAAGSDSIWLTASNFAKDDQWHVVIYDASTFRPDTFKAATDGKYYCNYIRFDIFNTPMSADSWVDIAYVGIADSIDSLCRLNADLDKMTLFSKGKTEYVDVKTGNITDSSGNVSTEPTPPPVEPDAEITVSKDTTLLIAPGNAQGYKASSVHYFARFDSINGYGPGKATGVAFDTGSNDVSGFSIIDYNGNTLENNYLVLAGWNLVKGGVQKYVWSADGGETWNDIQLYQMSAADAASAGMLDFAKIKYPLSVDFSNDLQNSAYQGGLSGPASAKGIAADLSQYVGQTVDVTFAVVPVAESDSLCILAHIKGVSVADER